MANYNSYVSFFFFLLFNVVNQFESACSDLFHLNIADCMILIEIMLQFKK